MPSSAWRPQFPVGLEGEAAPGVGPEVQAGQAEPGVTSPVS
jgi:hypothetical protein